jgi:hypothetical protein
LRGRFSVSPRRRPRAFPHRPLSDPHGSVSDVHGLEVDAGQRWISVKRSWDDRDGLVDPKSKAGVRLTLLCDTLRTILAEHVRRTGRTGDDLIFGKTASAPFVTWTVGKHAEDAWTATKLERPGFSEARADRYMGHPQNTVGDRYRHRLRGQLAEDAQRLEEYLHADVAEVVELPTGAETGAHGAQAASLSGTG